MRVDLKIFRLIIAVSGLFLFPIVGYSQTAPAGATLVANPVYEKNCAKCHGKTAEGRHFGGPSLIAEKATAAPADELRNIIANGKGHMPRFTGKLTSEEIDTLVQQIKAAGKK
jgi:mono/diheme cytochrome c family protein